MTARTIESLVERLKGASYMLRLVADGVAMEARDIREAAFRLVIIAEDVNDQPAVDGKYDAVELTIRELGEVEKEVRLQSERIRELVRNI
jgi:hypothetical protein